MRRAIKDLTCQKSKTGLRPSMPDYALSRFSHLSRRLAVRSVASPRSRRRHWRQRVADVSAWAAAAAGVNPAR